ncbi:MAG: ketoacyl-ACP synthase III [Thermodesulfovibrionales bacterium]|nr:ketoacyl-ACP synthase III [Thermodesulfovibrionales bacterium]
MLRAKITATGSYTPERILSNQDIEKIIDTSDAWITERTGIKERRIAYESQITSDLAYEASLIALKERNIDPLEIDLIIVATVSGDMPFPSTACILQKLLKAKNAVAFDINAACSGFIYAMSIANSFIKTHSFKKVLIVGVEVLSKFLDWSDRTTCILFGDGAGAAILEPSESESGILSTHIYSDGSLWDLIYLPGGGAKHPTSHQTVDNRLHYIKMKGNETFKVAVKTLENLVVETLKVNNLEPAQISLLIPHQANLRIIIATAKRLGIPMNKVFVNIDKYGNTSAASIPIALDEALKQGKIKKDDYILLEAFGAGLTWASALIRW